METFAYDENMLFLLSFFSHGRVGFLFSLYIHMKQRYFQLLPIF